MKIRTIKIGTQCTDIASGLPGTVTHWKLNLGQQLGYLFQPSGLNPETGQPVSAVYLEAERLKLPDGENPFEEVEVPFDILGTEVTHDASGFKGTATAFVQHPHGCFHIYIQPKGRLGKTNGPISDAHFALTACSGPAIPKKSPQELKEEEQRRPSPDEFTREEFDPRGPTP